MVRLVAGGANRVLNVTAGNVSISNLTVTGGGLAGALVTGGGIDNGAGTLVLHNVTVTGNHVTNTSGGTPSGGGVSNADGTLEVFDSAITGNAATVTPAGGGVPEGGGIANGTGVVTLTRTTVTGNTTSIASVGGDAEGGGVESGGGSLTIADSTIAGNHATGGSVVEGGGVFAFETAVTVTGSTIAGNDATVTSGGSASDGGGVFVGQGSLALTNATVSGNSASAPADSRGGGILVLDAPLQATNATIASNTAAPGGQGGNALLQGSSTTRFTPLNTIVSGGTAASGANCSFVSSATTQSLGHNLDSLNQCGFTGPGDLTSADPKLAALAANGGPTQTRAIAVDSPAIDAGDNAGCPATDQRGVPRPQDRVCDIGAFERTFSADLAIAARGAPPTVSVGRRVTFTLDVTDTGPDPAAGVSVANLLPAHAVPVSALPSQGTCSGAPPSCALGALAAGAAAHVVVTVVPTRPGPIIDAPRVGGLRPDPNSSNDAASATVVATPLALTRLAATPGRFALGRRLPGLFRRRPPVGTTIRFTLSAPARVTLAFSRRAGRRILAAGALTVRGRAGPNRLRFQGRLSRRAALRRGTYPVTASAVHAFGNRSRAQRIALTLVRGR